MPPSRLAIWRPRDSSASACSYWLQTEAPRPDGGVGYPGLRLRGDVVGGTPDGLAPAPYVRESRRLRAEFTVLEQHIAHPLRPDGPELFTDSVGIGCYRIDLHPRISGAGYLDLGCWPFQIPLGAMIPVRIENLLPGGKNLGVTHITNGAFRVHPVEWNVGEVGGHPGGVLPRTKRHAEGGQEPSGASRGVSVAAAAARHRALLAIAQAPVRYVMETTNRRLRIGISGSYGGMNLGDEAILEGILSQLRATIPADITVFSRNPRGHARPAQGRARRLTRVADHEGRSSRRSEQLDLFILGGGGILYDRDAEEYLREVFIAHELDVPGHPLRDQRGAPHQQSARRAVREALNASASPVITVRDRLGIGSSRTWASPRRSTSPPTPRSCSSQRSCPVDALKAEGVEFDRHLVGFSVREPGPAAPDIDPEEYYALLANAADFVVERYDAEVVFVPMEKTDVQHSHAVVAHMQKRGAGRDPEAPLFAPADPGSHGPLRVRGRHATSLPDLRGAAGNSLRGAALRIEGDRPARRSGDGHAAARKHRNRPAHRQDRSLVGHS